jgi:hypothetical protein
MTGIIKPSTSFMPEPCKPVDDARAACGPAATTVRVEVPALFATETAVSEQVAAGLTAGEMRAQVTQTNLLSQHTIIEQALRELPIPITFLRSA